MLTTPGGFDEFISQAGTRLMGGLTPPAELPTPHQMEKLLKLAEEFGIKIKTRIYEGNWFISGSTGLTLDRSSIRSRLPRRPRSRI
jgi:hypothetical protein